MKKDSQPPDGANSFSEKKTPSTHTEARFCPKCEQYAKLVSTETDATRSDYGLFIQERWDCLACGTARVTYWYDWRKGRGHL